MADVEIRGVEDFQILARRIRTHADRKALQRELNAGLNRVSKPVREDMKASVPASLPSRGGLASLIHRKTSISARTRAGGRFAGVRLVAQAKGSDIASLNRGRLRHPVFGTRAWVNQTAGVDKGFLDEPFDKSKPEVTQAIYKVLDDVARKVAR